MDLEAKKIKRDARIKAKEERIKAENVAPEPEGGEITEQVDTGDTSKEAKEENLQDSKPEKKPE